MVQNGSKDEQSKEKNMHGLVRKVFVEFVLRAEENDLSFASIIILRQVSPYFKCDLGGERLLRKAMKSKGQAFVIMYTLLRPRTSYISTPMLQSVFRTNPSPLCMLLMTANVDIYHHHPNKEHRITPPKGVPISPLILDSAKNARLVLVTRLREHSDASTVFMQHYLMGNFNTTTIIMEMMRIIVTEYPAGIPLLPCIVTLVRKLQYIAHLRRNPVQLGPLFIATINLCVEFKLDQEDLLVNLLRSLHSPYKVELYVGLMVRYVSDPSEDTTNERHFFDKTSLPDLLLHTISVGWYKMAKFLLQINVSPGVCNRHGFSTLMLLARDGQADLYALARSKLSSDHFFGEKYFRGRGRLHKNVLHYACNPDKKRDRVPIQARLDTIRVILHGGQIKPDELTFTKEELRIFNKYSE